MVYEKLLCITCSIFTKSSCDLTILLIVSNNAEMKFVNEIKTSERMTEITILHLDLY